MIRSLAAVVYGFVGLVLIIITITATSALIVRYIIIIYVIGYALRVDKIK